MLAPENQCSLNERHPVRRVGDAERARDGVGEMPFECYRKGIGHFLGRRYNLPRWLIIRTGTKLNDGGPIEICFSHLLLITMTWRPFRARRPGGRFPGLKPWAKFFSPSGAINYPKSCLSSRHSTPGYPLWPFGPGPKGQVT